MADAAKMELKAEIRELTDKYARLEPVVDKIIKDIFPRRNYPMLHITHRLKTQKSIMGKLERRADEYSSIYEMNDILGFRVICYFPEDIDLIGDMICDNFRIDNSMTHDKRALIAPTSFGYLSLHYTCALPEDKGYSEELCGLWFEVQIRTILQHAWAEIEHDLGYKTEFGIPRAIRRKFSRAASLLETADFLFEEIRNDTAEYTAHVKKMIENDSADDMFLDNITIREFTERSHAYLSLLGDIAGITGADIIPADPEGQLPMLDFLGVRTLGDLVSMIGRNHELAVSLAEEILKGSEIDELASTAAFYYLYRAELISGSYSRERIGEFFALMTDDQGRIERNTESVMSRRTKH